MLTKLYFERPDLRIAEVDIHRLTFLQSIFFRLLHILAGWVAYCNENLCHTSDSNLRLEQKNAFISGDTVYKCFDYRNRNPLIIPSYQCSPDIYLDASLHLIEDVTEIINWQDPDRGKEEYLRIISYTFVKGIVGHFTSLAEGLLKLHIKSLVYGDIRFANVVFNEGGDRATIIDFDYSGVNNRKTYPTRFNLDITDGRRHSSVGGEKVLKLEHDVFSF